MTKSKEKSYIVVAKTGKLVLEVSSRKKAKRIARKKYKEQYRVEKSYVIISGSNLKEALISLKKEISLRTTSKTKTLSKKTVKKTESKKTGKKKSPASKSKKTSMLEDELFQEEKSIARMNKRNAD